MILLFFSIIFLPILPHAWYTWYNYTDDFGNIHDLRLWMKSIINEKKSLSKDELRSTAKDEHDEQVIKSYSLALSLLRQSASPTQSIVLSPFSLGLALEIIRDRDIRKEKQQMGRLQDCCPHPVTEVSMLSSTHIYINESISLKPLYYKYIQNKYEAEIEQINFLKKKEAVKIMNKFLERESRDRIPNLMQDGDIDDKTMAILINIISFRGEWRATFNPELSRSETFHGVMGDRKMIFMKQRNDFKMNRNNKIGTVIHIPYEDRRFKFFIIMPRPFTNFESMKMLLTGEILHEVLTNVEDTYANIQIPKFEIELLLDGKKLFSKLGLKNETDISQNSDKSIKFSKIAHIASIKVSELNREESAHTYHYWIYGRHSDPQPLIFDRPFVYGILRNDDIIFMGQLV